MASPAADLIQELTMTVRCSRERGYQFVMDGSRWPTRVVSVTSGSHASHAGLKAGDFLLTVNGRDVIRAPAAQVEAIISYSAGSPLTLRVARVATRSGAVAAVQRKYQDGVNSPKGGGVEAYQAALGSAFESAQNVLDILGLPQQPIAPAVTATTSSPAVQEVEVALGGNNSDLSSPPSSPESSDAEYDPLLDFSRGLDSYSLPPPRQEASRAAVVGSVLKANQALRKIRDITASLAAEKTQQTHTSATPLVFSEASMNVSAKPAAPKASSPPPLTTPPPSALTPSPGPIITPPSPSPSPSPPPPPAVTSTAPTHPPHGRSLPPHSAVAHPPKLLIHRDPTHTVPTHTLQQLVPSEEQPVSSEELKVSVDEEKGTSESPPPVPPYTPSSPDRFPLSNKPAYQLEVKRQRHTYEEVMLDRETEEPRAPPPPVKMRIRGHGAKDQLPAKAQDVSNVMEPLRKQKSFTPVQASSSSTSADMVTACQGLPENVHSWKPESVNKWLRQLNPSLYKLYGPNFTRHKITGHSLLLMNQAKLLTVGITNKEHRVQLASAIARLRLHQEQAELEELSRDVSWL